MNVKKILFYAITAMIIFNAYLFITIPSKESIAEAEKYFNGIVHSDIERISIVISRDGDYSYLEIKDKKIIRLFMDSLKNDTYIPKNPTGQYNYRYVISLHDKNGSYLLILESETFNSDNKGDSVEITLFKAKDLDVFNIYYKSIITDQNFFSIFSQLYGFGDFTFRNHQIYGVLNKYIKGKGIRYDRYNNSWVPAVEKK